MQAISFLLFSLKLHYLISRWQYVVSAHIASCFREKTERVEVSVQSGGDRGHLEGTWLPPPPRGQVLKGEGPELDCRGLV